MSQPLDKSEFEAVLEARRDLGPEMEPALVESFAEKVVAEIRRQQAQGSQAGPLIPARPTPVPRRSNSYNPMAMGIVSMALAIPLTAVALSGGILLGLAVWVGIVAINIAAAFGASRRDGQDRL